MRLEGNIRICRMIWVFSYLIPSFIFDAKDAFFVCFASLLNFPVSLSIFFYLGKDRRRDYSQSGRCCVPLQG